MLKNERKVKSNYQLNAPNKRTKAIRYYNYLTDSRVDIRAILYNLTSKIVKPILSTWNFTSIDVK